MYFVGISGEFINMRDIMKTLHIFKLEGIHLFNQCLPYTIILEIVCLVLETQGWKI